MIKTITVDDQNYESIVENARKAIRKYAPYWTDENAHDPGITLIEMMAWLKEMLQFYMDQSTEALEIQYLRLLGLELDYGEPAKTVVQSTEQSEPIRLEAGTKLYKGRYTFENCAEVYLEPIFITDIQVSETDGPRSVYQNLYNGLTVYPFGEIPKVGSSLMIEFSEGLDLNFAYKLYFKFYEDYGTKRNPIVNPKVFSPLAEIEFFADCHDDHWQGLKVLRDDTYGFIQSGLVSLRVFEQSPRRFTRLKVVLKASYYDFAPRLMDLFNRVFEVVQLDSRSCESDPSLYFDGTGLPNQRIELPYYDVYYGSLQVEVAKPREKGKVKWQRLKQVRQMLDAPPEGLCFRVDASSNCLVFGDDVHGFIPKKGRQNIRICHLQRSYLDQGNIMLDKLVNADESQIFKCLDHARGGKKPNTLESLKAEVLRRKAYSEVCVSAEDYERAIYKTQGLHIKQVKCLPLFRPGLRSYPEQLAENTVSLFVIPNGSKDKNLLNPAYLKNLSYQIEQQRPLTTEVLILNPNYFEIQVYCELESKLSSPEAEALAKEILLGGLSYHLGDAVTKSYLYKVLRQSGQIQQIRHMVLSCKQPVQKNHLGDLLIPPDGVAVISQVDVVIREDK